MSTDEVCCRLKDWSWKGGVSLTRDLIHSDLFTQQFQKAADSVKKLKSRPTDEELLQLYGLFKQSTEGDVNTSRPGLLDLKGKAKWDAWNERKGMAQEEAKLAYIARVNQLIEQYGLLEEWRVISEIYWHQSRPSKEAQSIFIFQVFEILLIC